MTHHEKGMQKQMKTKPESGEKPAHQKTRRQMRKPKQKLTKG